jgi:hypothetical protein
MSPATRAAHDRYHAALAEFGSQDLASLAFYGDLPKRPPIPASAYKGPRKDRKNQDHR